MNDNTPLNTGHMERYLSGDMPGGEKLRFEAELQHNKALNDQWQLYKAIDAAMHEAEKHGSHEAALKNTLQKLNAAYFRPEAPVTRMRSPGQWYKAAIAAAAVLVLVLSGYFLFFQNNTRLPQLADRYVKENLLHLSLTMDGAKDSLQQGIAAYNNKDYPQAIALFEALYKAHPDNSDALKYAGIAYLITKEYNRALACFDELAAKKELFSNPGLFLKAVTLLQRGLQGDNEQAAQLLQQVWDEKQDGSKEAGRWLKQ
ncbi:MAG TPA: tetratricopeptide repeat protein [Agriterribacter sp.]|nr:tetratricopeptide repeat protein [Agriterribacter sp.]